VKCECGCEEFFETSFIQNGIALWVCNNCGILYRSDEFDSKGFRRPQTKAKKYKASIQRWDGKEWNHTRAFTSEKHARRVLNHIKVAPSPLRLVDKYGRTLAIRPTDET